MANRRRGAVSLMPACNELEARVVLSGNSLSHAFDNLGHDIDHIANQVSHLGQEHHSASHAAANGMIGHNADLKVHYHHIVK